MEYPIIYNVNEVKSCLKDISIMNDFKRYVKASKLILTLLRTGLSASSGLHIKLQKRSTGGIFGRRPCRL